MKSQGCDILSFREGVATIDTKHAMTQEQNVFLANRNMAEYVFNSVKLEGCNVTLAETQMILKGENVGHLSLRDIQRILNLKAAWSYMLASFGVEINLDYLCKVNMYVFRNESFEGGKLRTKKSKPLPGTSYAPEIPVKKDVEAEIARLLASESLTVGAIKMFLWIYKAQLFHDGNRRTGLICANRRLIEAGNGVLTIKDTNRKEFYKRLDQYCDTDDTSLEQWLYDNCLFGLN
jgi:Fic family protein